MPEKIHGELPRFQYQSEEEISHISSLNLSYELLQRLQTDNDNSFRSYESLSLLPQLQSEIEKKIDVFENRFSLQWLNGLFYGSYLYWKNHNIPLTNATYIDIGCGAINPFGLMFLFLMLGAKKCICLEPDSLQNPDFILENLAQIVGKIIINPQKVIANYPITRGEIIKNIDSFKLEKLAQGNWEGLDDKRLIYLQESVTKNTIPDNEADVIVTNSVLEHLPDMDSVCNEFQRITKLGGYGIHNIDGVDHWSYGNSEFHPLEFLKIDTEEAIIHLSNRIRPLSFVEIFERNGFEVLEINPYGKIEVSDELRESFTEPFRSMSQEFLEVTQAYFLVKRVS